MATDTGVINPKHYDIVINGQRIQAVDIIEARFAQDAHLSQAAKYLLRAGHKTDSSYTKDVGKCIWWCVRALMFNKVKSIEVPAGAPIFIPGTTTAFTPTSSMVSPPEPKPAKRKYTRRKKVTAKKVTKKRATKK